MAFFQHFGRLIGGHWQGGFTQVLSRFTWELPQTLLGGVAGTVALMTLEIEGLQCRDGAVILRGWRKSQGWGGISFGTVIIGDLRIDAEINNPLYMHEFGHVLQSRNSGPLYLVKYGFASILSAKGRGIHSNHPVERDANLRARDYFRQQQGFSVWPHDIHPVGDSKLLPIRWWEFLPPVFPFLHLWQGLRDRNGVQVSR